MAGRNEGFDFELEGVEIPLYDPEDLPEGAANPDGLKRGAFRTAPAAPGEAVVSFDGETYDIIDIGTNGVAVRRPKGREARVGRKLRGVLVRIEGETFTCDARIAHLSPMDASDHGRMGLKLLGLHEAARSIVAAYNKRLRKSMFGDSGG